MTTLHGGYDYSVISVHFFICLDKIRSMESNTNLLFENKIGCVANLFGFNGGEREILKTASWISLNNMMLSQQKNYTEDEHHTAQWMLVIQTAKNVATFLDVNKNTSNDLWKEFEKIQSNDGQLLQLIDYLVERCR